MFYASTKATNSGDVIFLNPGTYYESQRSSLYNGVSINGSGMSSIVVILDNIKLIEAKNNNTISNLLIDGNNSTGVAIIMDNGSNLIVRNCSFKNFAFGARHFADFNYEYIIELKNSSYITINNNIIQGGIRAFVISQLDVYSNQIGKPVMSVDPETGIYLSDIEGLKIRDNYFQNLAYQVELIVHSGASMSDVYISSNIMTDIGANSNEMHGYGVMFEGLTTAQCRNINIVNNTMVTKVANRMTMVGIMLPEIGNVTDVKILNNIIQGFKYASILSRDSIVRLYNLEISNNIMFENAIPGFCYAPNNLPYFSNGGIPSNYISNNVLVTDPMFVSNYDFHLKEESPAIRAGQYIDWIATDYYGYFITNPPHIGAHSGDVGTAINDVTYKSGILVYPVPAKDRVTVSLKDGGEINGRLLVMNRLGVIIIDRYVNSAINYTLDFNLSTGIYYIRVHNKNGNVLTSKIVVL